MDRLEKEQAQTAAVKFKLRTFLSPHMEELGEINFEDKWGISVEDALAYKDEEVKERLCLRCDTKFISSWKGNRLCPSCGRYNNQGLGSHTGMQKGRNRTT